MAARRPSKSSRNPGSRSDIRNARKDTRLASKVKTKPRARKTAKKKTAKKDEELEALTPPPRILRLDLLLLAIVLVFVLIGWHFFPMTGTEAEVDPEVAAQMPVPREMAHKAEEASEHYASGNLEGAAQCYEDIILHYPDNLFAWSNLGVVRYQQREFKDASVALEQSVRLNGQDAFSHSMLGIVYYHMGRRGAAIESLRRSIELKRDDPKTLNYLGMALSQEGKRNVAERLLRRAVALVPEYGDAHYNLAVALLLKDVPEPDTAMEHYQRARELGVPESHTFEEFLRNTKRSSQQAKNTAG